MIHTRTLSLFAPSGYAFTFSVVSFPRASRLHLARFALTKIFEKSVSQLILNAPKRIEMQIKPFFTPLTRYTLNLKLNLTYQVFQLEVNSYWSIGPYHKKLMGHFSHQWGMK